MWRGVAGARLQGAGMKLECELQKEANSAATLNASLV